MSIYQSDEERIRSNEILYAINEAERQEARLLELIDSHAQAIGRLNAHLGRVREKATFARMEMVKLSPDLAETIMALEHSTAWATAHSGRRQ